MSTLKRKDGPGGDRPAKSAKKSKETQSATKDAAAKNAKASTKSNSKSTTGSTERPKPSVVSVLKDEEPMFPRGGGSVLTPLEQKKIQIEAKADAMREEEFNTGKKSTKSKDKKSKSKSKKDQAVGSKPDEQTVQVESLSFKVCATCGWILNTRLLLGRNSPRAPWCWARSHASTLSTSKLCYRTTLPDTSLSSPSQSN